jgi:nickel-dependent lactate racemase
MSLKVVLPYGDKSVSVELPQDKVLFVIKPMDFLGVDDEEGEIRRAIRNPIACPKIPELVKAGQKVMIIADDLTRVTPCKKIIPILLDELNAAGVRDEDIKVIVALGTHRPMTDEELLKRFGKEILSRVSVINHTSKDEKNLLFLGKLASGTLFWINKEVYKADIKIALGNVIPHCYGGWAAGAKAILPGVSGEITTGMVHLAGARITTDRLIGDENNPVRQEMEEAGKKVRLNMIVNTVLNGRGQIIKVFAGDMIKAHREAIRKAEKIYVQEAPREADIVIVSSHPADIDYYQAIKGLFAAYKVVKRGGTMILLTPCPEGIAQTHPVIEECGCIPFSEEIDQMAQEKKIEDLAGVACAMVHAQMKEKTNLIFVSDGLTKEMCDALGVQKAESLKEAVKIALKRHGNKATFGVLTHSELIALVKKPRTK